jgi:hypothetical protein
MTSLALLAHPADHAAPAFNGLFDATAATVIPVLFLAVAVQGDLLQRLVRLADSAAARVIKAPVRAMTVSYLCGVAAVAMTLYSAAGEIQAILSLYWQRTVGEQSTVLYAVLITTAAAVSGPVQVIGKSMFGDLRSIRDSIAVLRYDGQVDEGHDPGSATLAEEISPPAETGQPPP